MILIVGGACQGKTEYAKVHFPKLPVWDEYHLEVKRQLQEQGDPVKEAVDAAEKYRNGIIISNELGYGLVPMDPFERQYREVNGRVNCYLAAQADMVIRVICGVGTVIKGRETVMKSAGE